MEENRAHELAKDQAIDQLHEPEGIEPGEICGRDGCQGIIEEKEIEGGCSCHTGNAPCSWCTKGRALCPVCEWEQPDA